MGTDMIRLYAVIQPILPIPIGGATVFQREYSKEVFPGDPNYGEIEDAGKLDIISYADPNDPLIVDIKTSAVDFPEQQGMAAFDSQLRRYSWLTGFRRVALLWFKKCGIGYKKGYSATVLEPHGNFVAGQECVIAKVDDLHAWIVTNDFMVEEMEKAQGRKGTKLDTTKDAEARQQEWLQKYAAYVPLDALTRQRLQFNQGRVSDKSAEDAGLIAGRQIIGIVNATKSKQWPNTFGVRYPHDDRNDSYFRAFILGDETYKATNFVKSDEQSFDDLFREDEQ
jgi:hypothetical protein